MLSAYKGDQITWISPAVARNPICCTGLVAARLTLLTLTIWLYIELGFLLVCHCSVLCLHYVGSSGRFIREKRSSSVITRLRLMSSGDQWNKIMWNEGKKSLGAMAQEVICTNTIKEVHCLNLAQLLFIKRTSKDACIFKTKNATNIF